VARELLEGLLGADVVSLQTERFRKNFVRTCGRLLDDVEVAVRRCTIVRDDGRTNQTLANPISIDAREFAESAAAPATEEHLRHLREQIGDRRVLLGIDRLDYTKGIIERLEAFELLLERHPHLRDELTLVQIAVPSRGSVAEYRQLRRDVEGVIGRVNCRFTSPGGEVPVHYLHRGYRRARAQRVHRIDLQLRKSVFYNSFDVRGTARSIAAALALDRDERRRRLRGHDPTDPP
jgi:trehalose-6-phosphate synthase